MKSGASDPFGDESGEKEKQSDGADETEPAVSESGSDEVERSERGGEPASMNAESVQTSDESVQTSDENTNTASDGPADTTSGGSGDSASGGSSADGSERSLDRSQIPYTLRRDNVKDERPHVHQLFVRDDTDDAAREAERGLEDVLDTDVYRLDAREAIYRVGMRHPEEVAELLEDWGYNF